MKIALSWGESGGLPAESGPAGTLVGEVDLQVRYEVTTGQRVVRSEGQLTVCRAERLLPQPRAVLLLFDDAPTMERLRPHVRELLASLLADASPR